MKNTRITGNPSEIRGTLTEGPAVHWLKTDVPTDENKNIY